MFRYSLAALLAGVLIVAFFCAALVNATLTWVYPLKTATWFALLTAVLAAVACEGRLRATAAGIAIFGWGVLLFADSRQTPFVDSAVDLAFATVHGPPPQRDDGLDEDFSMPETVADFMHLPRTVNHAVATDAPNALDLYMSRKDSFSQISYLGLAMLLSILGGCLGRFFTPVRRPDYVCVSRIARGSKVAGRRRS
jgi:hypothetical protein